MEDVLNLIKKIGEKEDTLTERVFISPIYGNEYVITRINGLVHKLGISDSVKPGWYKLKARNFKRAKVVGEADFVEIDEYLKLLTKIRMVLVYKNKELYYGVPLKNNIAGFDVSDLIPIFLTSDDQVRAFEKIICGFDGANFWYYQNDITSDPSRTEYLRDSFEKLLRPDKLQYTGLTLEEKIAYTLRFNLDKKARESLKVGSIKSDVEFAGGEFVRFIERNDHYSVTYKIGGQQYTSYVTKDDSHHVLTAGVCLQGHDREYDLTSLITVLREGQRRGLIHRYNNTTG
jgi:hypothetical protein